MSAFRLDLDWILLIFHTHVIALYGQAELVSPKLCPSLHLHPPHLLLRPRAQKYLRIAGRLSIARRKRIVRVPRSKVGIAGDL